MDSFDEWNRLKQKLNKAKPFPYFHPRQVWHMHIGKNVGNEQSGKDKLMRPVLIYKKVSPNTFLGIPLTRSKQNSKFCIPVYSETNENSYALLDQIRLFDSRRLKRKKPMLPQQDWINIVQQLSQIFKEDLTLNPCGHECESQVIRHEKNTPETAESQINLLQGLNPAQREAVEHVYGPLLVLAGPGTGKTHLLTTRIAHILKTTDCFPSNILCLTFTENAAVEMRRRLVERIGNEAYQMQISTFHGFAQWIMDHYGHLFGDKIQGKNIADDLQKALIFSEIIQKKTWDYFRPSFDELAEKGNFFGAIDKLKREHIDVQKLKQSIPEEQTRLESDPNNFYKKDYKQHKAGDIKPNEAAKIERKIGKLKELCTLWEMYEEAMAKHRCYDFNDLINWVIDELQQNQELRYDLQERFQWILVDEYQDTNTAQNEILWSLTDGVEDPNIFAVGDDDQSIYRFQGASMANILDFRKRFANHKEVTLETNYRSYQPILDAAYSSISNNTSRANQDKSLTAVHKGETPIQINSFHSPYSESQFLAKTIQKHIEKGTKPSSIAILVRKNSEIERLSGELQKFGIRTNNPLLENIFSNTSVLALIDLLILIENQQDNVALTRLLHADFWNIKPEDRLTFGRRIQKQKTSGLDLLIEKEQPDLFTENENSSLAKELQNWGKWFLEVRLNYGYLRPAVLIEKLLYESGLANHLTDKKDFEGWQCIKRFIDWAREAVRDSDTLENLLHKVELHQKLGIPVRPNPLPPHPESIQIMTAHKSKGLEFDVVFIPGLLNGSWGNLRGRPGISLPPIIENNITDEDPNEEERRLFFVALTRAKQTLQLSYALSDLEGREKVPSQFIQEIPENIIAHHESSAEDEQINDLLPIFFEKQEKTITKGEKELLQNIIKNFTWSATSLQAYLDCPRQFLYQYLYRLPRKPEPVMAQGVALHQALERYFRADQKDQSKTLLLNEYETAMRGQNIPQNSFDQLIHAGKKILENYYANKLQNPENPNAINELEYNMGKHKPQIDGIRLTGMIDRLTFVDNSKKTAHLVDYKSGKPRTVKHGERLWRQLVFYDLLARNGTGINWKVADCTLEFLTPDSNGKLGSKTLEITEEDRLQVMEELKDSHAKVMNLEFPTVPNPTNDEFIEYWNNFGEN